MLLDVAAAGCVEQRNSDVHHVIRNVWGKMHRSPCITLREALFVMRSLSCLVLNGVERLGLDWRRYGCQFPGMNKCIEWN